MNTFLPLGSDDDTSWSGIGLVAFKLFLIAAMWRGVSVNTIICIVLIGGLVAVVLSIILKARAGVETRTGSTASARWSPNPDAESRRPLDTAPAPHRPQAGVALPVVSAGSTTYAGCWWLAGEEEAPLASTSASTSTSTPIEEEEAQGALAHLARLERQRHASWSNAKHE
jgi:hypothetical protein